MLAIKGTTAQLLLLAVAGAAGLRADCDVRAFGATGRKADLATKAIQAAIDACAAKGGGTVLLSSYEFDRAPNVQSSVQHELGHSFGLPHVDVYGYDMGSNDSLMSYNPKHHTNGLTPSATLGTLTVNSPVSRMSSSVRRVRRSRSRVPPQCRRAGQPGLLGRKARRTAAPRPPLREGAHRALTGPGLGVDGRLRADHGATPRARERSRVPFVDPGGLAAGDHGHRACRIPLSCQRPTGAGHRHSRRQPQRPLRPHLRRVHGADLPASRGGARRDLHQPG